jgi:hypothetical protein
MVTQLWPGETPKASPWPGENVSAKTAIAVQPWPGEKPKPPEKSLLRQGLDYVEAIPGRIEASQDEAMAALKVQDERINSKKGFLEPVEEFFKEKGRDITSSFERNVMPELRAAREGLRGGKEPSFMDFWTNAPPPSVRHAASAAFSALPALATGIAGNEMQALTGVPKDVAGNIVYAPAKGAAKVAEKGYDFTRGALSPTRASPAARATGMFMRKSRGLNQLQADQAGFRLGKLDKRLGTMNPKEQLDFYEFLENRTKPQGATGPGAVRDGQVFTRDEEALARKHGLTTPDLKAANQFRDTFREYADKAETIVKANKGSAPEFIKDYFPHMWEQKPEEVERRMSNWLAGGRQGSGASLRKREIPTIADGMAAGLTPKYGPIQTAQVYAENMSKFLSTNEVQAYLKGQGYAAWHRRGSQPEGWIPLDGIMTERKPRMTGGGRPPGPRFDDPEPGARQLRLPAPSQGSLGGAGGRAALGQEPPFIDQPGLTGRGVGPARPGASQAGIGAEPGGPQLEDAAAKARNVTPPKVEPKEAKKPAGDQGVDKEVLYARPEVARLYNNFISKPFIAGKSPLETLGSAGFKAGVADMLWKFALSAYHVSTVSLESIYSDMARGVEQVSRGNIKGGLKSYATSPIGPVRNLIRGNRMMNELKAGTAKNPMSEKLNQQFARAGGEIHMDRDYRGTAMKSFYESIKSGTLKRDVNAQLERIAGPDKTKLERMKAAADGGLNLLTSISGPLFQDMIPRMKMGAWSQMMEAYMKERPNATQQMLDEYGAKALDSIDNRFGEMAKDNMFWSRKTQQILQIAMRAPNWTIGSVREIAGGVHDLPASVRGVLKGDGMTPRTAYVLGAMATGVPLINSIMGYLKTGKGPESVKDLQAYPTGGTDPRLGGSPERALLPGNQKEIYEWRNAMRPGSGGFANYAYGKLNDAPGLATDLWQNKNYAGQDVYGPGARPGAMASELSDRAAPIALEIAKQGQMKGSRIGGFEQFMGVRTAPSHVSNPEALQNIWDKAARKRSKSATRTEARREARYAQ